MKGAIVIQTDFGNGGGSAMRGTCKIVDPELDIYEVNHTITKFNIPQAARSLHGYVSYWPEGTVFVSVVDPGVGTSRKASVALLNNGSYVVTPDNGSLTMLLDNPGIKAIRVIDEKVNRLKGTENVSIFHGRDLFAYCGAKLAAGIIDFEGVGPEYPVSEIVRYKTQEASWSKLKVCGVSTAMMVTFGNLETSIPLSYMEKAGFKIGDMLKVTICHDEEVVYSDTIEYQISFGYVDEGKALIYNSSDGVVGIGINRGDFIRTHGIGFGENWTVTIEKDGE